MREILFRGKRNDNGEWVSSGNLITFNDEGEGKQFFVPEANAKCTSTHDGQDNIIAFPSGVFYKVDPKTIGQYTGRTDKNSKNIFEGDIVEVIHEGVYLCRWDEGNCEFGLINENESLGIAYVSPYDIVVIGNIHDNPELLEVTADG